MSVLPALMLAATLCVVPHARAIQFRSSVEVSGSSARLSDIADLSGLAAAVRHNVGSIVLLRTDGRSADFAVPVHALAARLRGIAPALACAMPQDEGGTIHVRTRPQPDAGKLALPPARAEVAAGEALSLVTSAGPVRVARDVATVQRAKSGQRLFVRTAEGELVSARFSGGLR